MDEEILKSYADARQRMLDSFTPLIERGLERGGLPKPDVDRLYSSPDDLQVEVLCEDLAPLRDGTNPERSPPTRQRLAQLFGR